MKRIKIRQSSSDERLQFEVSRYNADEIHDDDIQLNSRFASGRTHHQNTLEAEVQEGDTLQALAIRYNCSVSDIKRLNKIERDLEIHAFKTIRVPQTAENLLVNHFPIVHKSGQNSPKHTGNLSSAQQFNNNHIVDALKQLAPTDDEPKEINITQPSINDIILNTTIVPNCEAYHDDEDANYGSTSNLTTPNDEEIFRQRQINARQYSDQYSCSGSDCDISWICLLICILALCFAIPLIYVVYIAEHHVDPDIMHMHHN